MTFSFKLSSKCSLSLAGRIIAKGCFGFLARMSLTDDFVQNATPPTFGFNWSRWICWSLLCDLSWMGWSLGNVRSSHLHCFWPFCHGSYFSHGSFGFAACVSVITASWPCSVWVAPKRSSWKTWQVELKSRKHASLPCNANELTFPKLSWPMTLLWIAT